MPWFNVDDSFHSHPKVLATESAALGLWVIAGSWSSGNLTEGFVPDHVLPRLLPDSAKLARALVTAGLWRRVQGGYLFHDWTQWNESRDAILRKRAQAAERQRRHRSRVTNGSVTRDVTRDERVSHSAQSNPLSVVDVINHVADRYARLLDDDDFVKSIIDLISERTGRDIAAGQARAVAQSILAASRSQPSNPRAYVLTSIRKEPDPKGRFLPPADARDEPSAQARPPWCGSCDQLTRLAETGDGQLSRCPDCHPLAPRKAS